MGTQQVPKTTGVERARFNAGDIARQRMGQADFARNLYQAMRAKNLSASELAAAIWGTRPTTIRGKVYMVARGKDRISQYLRAGAYPRLDALEKMAELLDTTPHELAPDVLGLSPSKPPSEVTLLLLDGPGEPRAALQLNVTLPAAVAVEITRLISQARTAEQPRDAAVLP